MCDTNIAGGLSSFGRTCTMKCIISMYSRVEMELGINNDISLIVFSSRGIISLSEHFL